MKMPVIPVRPMFAAVAASLVAFPAQAAPGGAGYMVELASPVTVPRQAIVGGILWKCDGSTCRAPADGARPQVVCRQVVRSFGAISRFAWPKGELAAEAIAACNAA